jgi:hypothetical protein
MVIIVMLKLAAIWLGLTIVLAATTRYVVQAIRPHCPDWWRRTIMDYDPEWPSFSDHPLFRK